MKKTEFKRRIAEINKNGKVHIKVLSKELGEAMDNNRTRCEWFKPETEFAEITVGEEKIRIKTDGKFNGQLLDSNGNVLKEFEENVEPLTEPVELQSDAALGILLDGIDENYYIDFDEGNTTKLVAESGNKVATLPYPDVITAILAEDLFVEKFGKTKPKEEPEPPTRDEDTSDESKKKEIPDISNPSDEKDEVAESNLEVTELNTEASKENINYNVLPLDVMSWFISEFEKEKNSDGVAYELLLNILDDAKNPNVIAVAAMQVEKALYKNSADMLLAYAEARQSEKPDTGMNDIIYHFLKSIASDTPEEEKTDHKRAVLWALLDMLTDCSISDLTA